jgi:hypothetical protein
MLTDTEVADAARQALADELASLAPPADLLARVRARHARAVRARQAATAAVATVTAGGLATAIIAGISATAPGPPRPDLSHPTAIRTPAGTQRILLDGLTVKVAPPFQLTAVAHRRIDAVAPGRLTVIRKFFLFSGKIPAGATPVRLGARTAYVLKAAAGPSLYVPFQAATQVHYLVLSFGHISERNLVKLAGLITIAGKPGYLRSLPREQRRPVTHCPCG